jgi:hypothetical protein
MRRRTGTLDLAALAGTLPAETGLALERTLSSLGTSTGELAGPATVDVWVDGDGLVRQLTLQVSGAGGATGTFTTRFVELGVDPGIVVPSDAVDAAQVAWP